jgi:hypothetical protein
MKLYTKKKKDLIKILINLEARSHFALTNTRKQVLIGSNIKSMI